MYAITELSDRFWRITLPLPSVRHLPAARPINVYLLHGGAPALINAGHAASTRNLSAALHEIGCSPARIERIVATSWNPEVLGGALSFPHADLFVASPDMRAPRAYDTWLGQGRKEWEDALEVALDQDIIAEGLEEGAAEAFFDAYFAPVTDDLDFIPLRQGHILAMGDRTLEVLATPGPNEGHISLYDAEEDALFSGDLVTDGLPERVTNVQDYVSALERAAKADPEILYPNRGLVDEWGSFSLKRSGRFLNNFLTNAAQALGEGPTLMEFAAADLGFVPSDPIRFAATLLVYRAFLDEMVRARVIDARGTGWEREYGVDVEEENDPEAPGRAMRVSEDDPPPMP